MKLKFKGCASGEMLLEKILEEDSSYGESSRCSFQSDKRQLLANDTANFDHHQLHTDHFHAGSVHVTNI